MVGTATLLADHVLPHRPMRQWVLNFPYPLCFVLANPTASDEQGIGHREPHDLNVLDQ